MSTFADTGLVIDRLQDIFDDFIADLRSRWGDNVTDDVESVVGTIGYNMANLLADVNESLEDIVSKLNPNTSTGQLLSNIVALNGISRNASAYSTVTLNCTAAASANSTIPAGTQVTDSQESVIFATDATTVVPAGTTVGISATATEVGPFEAAIGSLTVIKTPVYAFESVTNPAAATSGQYQETDAELRARRKIVSQRSGSGGVSAIYGALTEVPNVEDVVVYENSGSITDSKGVPPGHVWSVVEGGTDNAVAAALFGFNAGKGWFGTTTVNYTPTPDTGGPYVVKFSRHTDVEIYFDVSITANQNTFPSDGVAQIKQAIVDYFNGEHSIEGTLQDKLSFGDDVIQSEIFSPIYSVPGHKVTSLKLGTSYPAVATSDISIDYDERAYVTTGNDGSGDPYITVNVTYQ